MSLTTTGIIGTVILIIVLFSKMPVGFVMAFIGFLGFSYVVNFEAGLNLLAKDVWDVFSSYGLTVIPLFVFMGQIAFHAGISRRLFDSAYVLFGHRRGGLAFAAVGACAAFSAVSGSTNATAATMASVTLPEMGVITPPVGVNVYVVYGVAKDVPLETIFKGVLPMLLALLVCNLIILLFPQIALFLPGLMR